MNTDIIILKYNYPQVEKNCIRSVITNTAESYNLTVVDNWHFKENIAKIWNKLIKNSLSDYICLLNSDTKVYKGWLKKMLAVFKKMDRVGCVGPSTNSSKNPQSQTPPEETMVDFSQYGDYVLSGFCLVFPKKVWQEVGGFPEDFGFYGQEVAFIDKIKVAGYKQIWRTDAFVWHKGSASVKKSGMDELKERRLGRQKYQEFRRKLYGNQNL